MASGPVGGDVVGKRGWRGGGVIISFTVVVLSTVGGVV